MRDAAHGALSGALITFGAVSLPAFESWLRIGSLAVGITLGCLAIRDRLKKKS